MKVEIQKAVFNLDLQPTINTMIDISLNSNNIEDCYNKFIDLKKSIEINFGKGGSHIWVSIRNKRILLITNN